MTEAQRHLVEQNLDLVRKIAHRRDVGHCWPENEYALSDGYLALIDSALRYDQAHRAGASFRTFAGHRVRGAVWDSIRSQRRTQGWMRTGYGSGRVTKRVVRFQPLVTQVREDGGEAYEHDPLDPSPTPEAQALASERLAVIRRAPLSRRERHVLWRRFVYGETCRHIGSALGITEGCVAKYEHRAVAKVRRYLETSLTKG